MQITQSVAYAIHAALRLAEHDESTPVACNKLAAEGGMPERFLVQLLRDLAKQGILNSTRGGGGGFMMARPPKEISLLAIIEAIEGPLKSSLPFKATFPGNAGDRLVKVLGEANEEVRRQLQRVSLADLLGKGKRG
jgi:Rrf2 family transcriptional regulator, cysteine metabolism repressor